MLNKFKLFLACRRLRRAITAFRLKPSLSTAAAMATANRDVLTLKYPKGIQHALL